MEKEHVYTSCILGMMRLVDLWVLRYFASYYIVVAGFIYGWTRLDGVWWTPIRLGMLFTVPFTILNQKSPTYILLHFITNVLGVYLRR